jgi:hypothetical protein
MFIVCKCKGAVNRRELYVFYYSFSLLAVCSTIVVVCRRVMWHNLLVGIRVALWRCCVATGWLHSGGTKLVP